MLFHSAVNPVKETEITDHQVPVVQQEESKTDIKTNKIVSETPKKDEHDENVKKDIFFRIWFGLSNREFVKIGVGSFAAAFSGISKPVFGFFIITIGVAYYKGGAKEKVGWYSLLFSGIGMLSLFSMTLQHYFFGVIGEKSMTNLRQALYSGITCIFQPLYSILNVENSNHLLTKVRIMFCLKRVRHVNKNKMSVKGNRSNGL